MDAYTRWAKLVVHTISCPTDPRTLALWSAHAGVSPGTLRSRCTASGVATAAARDFSRLLRIVVRSQHNPRSWEPALHLESRDPRTIRRLLDGAGLAHWPYGAAPPPIAEFLHRQRLVHARAATAVRQQIAATTHQH